MPTKKLNKYFISNGVINEARLVIASMGCKKEFSGSLIGIFELLIEFGNKENENIKAIKIDNLKYGYWIKCTPDYVLALISILGLELYGAYENIIKLENEKIKFKKKNNSVFQT